MATSLSRKLGIKPGHRVALVDAEDDLPALRDGWPEGAALLAEPAAPMDVIVLFAAQSADLARFEALRDLLAPAGGLWIAWPKKASGRATDLSFEIVQRVGLDLGLVDNKICAIDATWSGLRFVWRVADRPPKKKGSR